MRSVILSVNLFFTKILILVAVIHAIYEIYIEISRGTRFKSKIASIGKNPLIRDAVENNVEYTLISGLLDITFLIKNIHVNAPFKSICIFIFFLSMYILQFLPLIWISLFTLNWLLIIIIVMYSKITGTSVKFKFSEIYPSPFESSLNMLKKNILLCFFHNLRIVYLFKAGVQKKISLSVVHNFIILHITSFPFWLIKICYRSSISLSEFIINNDFKRKSRIGNIRVIKLKVFETWYWNILKSSEGLILSCKNQVIIFENGRIHINPTKDILLKMLELDYRIFEKWRLIPAVSSTNGMVHQVFVDESTGLSIGMTRDEKVYLNRASGNHLSPTKFISNFSNEELKISANQRCFIYQSGTKNFIEKKYLFSFYNNMKLYDFEEYCGLCIKSNALLFLSLTNEIIFQNENECYLKVFDTSKNYFNVYNDKSALNLLDSDSTKDYKIKHFDEIVEWVWRSSPEISNEAERGGGVFKRHFRIPE